MALDAKKRGKKNNQTFIGLWAAFFKKIQNIGRKKETISVRSNASSMPGIVIGIDELISLRIGVRNVLTAPSRNVSSQGSGGYRSPFRGRGMEFDEVRTYQEGDDIRRIDWRVTARTGVPYTKLFHEERERPVLVLTDMRQTMRFGTKNAFKSVVAAKASAIIGWSALENSDRIGGMVISASKSVRLSPHRSRKRLLGFLHALSEASADSSNKSGMSLSEALSELRRVSRAGSMVFVVSDFYEFNDDVQRQLIYLAAHCDVVCVKVNDILEKVPPPHGIYRISDGSKTVVMRADDENWRQSYVDMFAQKEALIRHFCNKRRISLVLLRTDEDVGKTINSGLYSQTRRSVSVVYSGKSSKQDTVF